MRKLIVLAVAGLVSSVASAESGFKLGLGYENGSVDSNYGSGWAEDFSASNPSGLGINMRYDIAQVQGLFVEIDITDRESDADVYDTDNITTSLERTELKIGYTFVMNDTTNLTTSISSADTEWTYEYDWTAGVWTYEADDSGVSFVLGLDKQLGNGVAIGSALSLGFETGIEVYATVEVMDNFDITASYSQMNYEMEFEEINNLGVPTGFGSAYGDGDMQFDTGSFRVTASYAF